MAEPVKPIVPRNRVNIAFDGNDYLELITSMLQWIHGKGGISDEHSPVIPKVDVPQFLKDFKAESQKKQAALLDTFLNLKTEIMENDLWLDNMSNDPEIAPATGPGAGTNKNPGIIKVKFKERMKTYHPLKSYTGFGWFRYDNFKGPEPMGPTNQHSPTWAYNVGSFWLTQIVPRSSILNNGSDQDGWPNLDKSQPIRLTAKAYYTGKRLDPETGSMELELLHKQVNFNIDRQTGEVFIDTPGGGRQTGITGASDTFSSYRIMTDNEDHYDHVADYEVVNKKQLEDRLIGKLINLPSTRLPSDKIPKPADVGKTLIWFIDDDRLSGKLSLGLNGTKQDKQLYSSAVRWTGTEIETLFITINLSTHTKPGVVEAWLINKANPTGFGLNVSTISIR